MAPGEPSEPAGGVTMRDTATSPGPHPTGSDGRALDDSEIGFAMLSAHVGLPAPLSETPGSGLDEPTKGGRSRVAFLLLAILAASAAVALLFLVLVAGPFASGERTMEGTPIRLARAFRPRRLYCRRAMNPDSTVAPPAPPETATTPPISAGPVPLPPPLTGPNSRAPRPPASAALAAVPVM